MAQENYENNIHKFWNDRAPLKQQAGSNDYIAKQLEINTLKKHIQTGQKILEIGCGNGITAIEFAKNFNIQIDAFDFSEKMIEEAKLTAKNTTLKGNINFQVADMRKLPLLNANYDIAYTERALINLPDWPSQAKAIKDITGLLKPGGRYLMCENSQEGLDEINQLRGLCQLPPITPPWHNRYLYNKEIASLHIENVKLIDLEHYSSTYYIISRVVNAWLAMQEGQQPQYDALVNKLGLILPPIGELGQGKLWIWEKTN
ncbi:class I SAM-dependent methyltransferase [Desulfobotulus mexicanus]|uniref:Class I SAM-dependent methyltransferase n=1 Tax=Desulfobotulus mexicanus TaxID=2586642 RepID=A0A5Q4VF51_9BACT|nr:class I SAM-dependent methyltransferase [Desulfobotulus mexicanus]TYT76295.1 class I SAM-dependent methyltransferase [Desulfobotulus mexicanus]